MITGSQIKAGIQQKIVRFIVDPNMGPGTVCEIREHYFGGETAEVEGPSEFLRNADMGEVADSIVEALLGIKEVDDCEYSYYEAVLKENLQADDLQGVETTRVRKDADLT